MKYGLELSVIPEREAASASVSFSKRSELVTLNFDVVAAVYYLIAFMFPFLQMPGCDWKPEQTANQREREEKIKVLNWDEVSWTESCVTPPTKPLQPPGTRLLTCQTWSALLSWRFHETPWDRAGRWSATFGLPSSERQRASILGDAVPTEAWFLAWKYSPGNKIFSHKFQQIISFVSLCNEKSLFFFFLFPAVVL